MRSSGNQGPWGPDPIQLVSLQEEEDTAQIYLSCTRFKERPPEDTVRKWPPASQKERSHSHQKPTLLS